MSARDDQIKVLLADDHALFREGAVEIFVAEDGMRVVGEAENGAAAVVLAEIEKPDVVLLDVEMPVMGAEGAIEGILRISPSSKVLVLTMYDEPHLVRKTEQITKLKIASDARMTLCSNLVGASGLAGVAYDAHRGIRKL